ncbi:MAG: type I-E CRISPR-associated endoribonuclease Cas2e [Dermabacter sp.]|nr:type I-E CRISPR-associated endoribonuclease Cas2e [Dermabacter sp.]
MMTLVLTACPAGLRGDLTKWLMEISPGVFVGRPTARVREHLWDRTLELCKDGKALLVFAANTDQGLEFRTHNHEWEPVNYDGLSLMLRPATPTPSTRTGWSNARNMQRSRNPAWARKRGETPSPTDTDT